MNALLIFLLVAGTLALLELLACLIVKWTRKRFQWMITPADDNPKITKDILDKFYNHGYDPELGWIRKANTSKNEEGRSGITSYNINARGARFNPDFESKTVRISCYGDSFGFGRQVNDDETWEHYLSQLTHTNVLNFSVGNYGLDQALLRLKREFPKNRSGIVLIGVVPSTICRVLCIWKHYNEFGNILGFKPAFLKKKGKFTLMKNIIDERKKFFELDKYLDHFRKNDYFYHTKFREDMIRFPYLFHVLKNPSRNLKIIGMTLYESLLKTLGKDSSYYREKMIGIIMEINKKLRVKLFKEDSLGTEIMEYLIDEFLAYAKQQKFTPAFVLLPQKDDITFIAEHGSYYDFFIKRLKKIKVIDLTPTLLKQNELDKLYSYDSVYGGHYSKLGNKIVAETIFNELKNLLNSPEEAASTNFKNK